MFTLFLLCIQDTDGIAFWFRLPAMKTKFPSLWYRAPYLMAIVLCALTTLGTLPLRGLLDLANIVMIFLLTVFVTAVWLGRGPSVMTAFLGVALFDFFLFPRTFHLMSLTGSIW